MEVPLRSALIIAAVLLSSCSTTTATGSKRLSIAFSERVDLDDPQILVCAYLPDDGGQIVCLTPEEASRVEGSRI
jgi:hypothetical protein